MSLIATGVLAAALQTAFVIRVPLVARYTESATPARIAPAPHVHPMQTARAERRAQITAAPNPSASRIVAARRPSRRI